MKKSIWMLCATATAALATSSGYAQSETAPAEATDSKATMQTEDIVVTARRVSENLQSIPLAVSAVSGATLQRQSIKEIKDLSATVPNLQIYSANTGGSSVVVAIRGQIQSNTGLLYVDPAVGVYVDGLNVPRNSGLRSGLVDIQRVEVLRGPQGTLYGRNTTGGAVSIYTVDPTDQFGGSIQASYGNYNAFNLQGIFNAPLAENLNMRVVAVHSEHDPYGHQIATGAGLNDENSTYLRGKIKYDAGGAFRATLTGDYFRYRSAGPIFHLVGLTSPSGTATSYSGRACSTNGEVAGPVAASCPGGRYHAVAGGSAAAFVRSLAGLPFTNAGLDAAAGILQSYVRRGSGAATGISFYDTNATSSDNYPFAAKDNTADSDGGSAVFNAEYDVSDDIMLRSISGWRSATRSEHYDFDGTPYTLFETFNGTPKDDFYSEEFQILGKTASLNWVVGGYYSLEDGSDRSPNVAFQGPTSIRYNRALTFTRNTSKAFFAQATYKATEALSVTLGARYTWDGKRTRNNNTSQPDPAGSTLSCAIPLSLLNDPNGPIANLFNPNGTPTGTQGPCGTILKGKFHAPTWLASVDYKIDDDMLVYAKYARGYRSGGLNGRANTIATTATFQNFRPEKLDEFEVGIKSELFDRRLRVNLAGYYDKYGDVQRTVTRVDGTTGLGFSTILNAAKARLYGIEGEVNFRASPELRINGSFGYLNAKYTSFPDVILGDRSNEDWPAPKWTYSIGASYEKATDFGTAGASLNWDYRSKLNLQPQAVFDPQVTQAGYGLLNGRLFVEFKGAGLEVAAFGRNLLAKKYYDAGISLETVGLNTLLTGDPRTFGLQLTKKFGAQ